MGYFELMPAYNCVIDGIVQACTSDQICQGQSTPQVPYSIDKDDKYSLNNWVEQLDLICASNQEMGWIGSSFFIGAASTCLLIPPLSDRKGRKQVFLVSMIL
jgi:MFS family permease